MIRTATLILPVALILAGCEAERTTPNIVGRVEVRLQSYPIEQLDNGRWRVIMDGGAAHCTRPTVEDCTFAARNYERARRGFDD